MEWSGVSLLMADHTLCPRPCLVEEGFFLGSPPGWLWSDFISSLTNTDLYESVFLVLKLPRVLGLGHWPDIYIDLGYLAFHPPQSGYSSNICVYVLIWIWVLILNFLDLCLNLCFCVADIVLMFKWVCVLELVSFEFLSLCFCIPWMELVLDLGWFCWMRGDSWVCVLIFWCTLCLILNFLGVFVLWVCCVWFWIFWGKKKHRNFFLFLKKTYSHIFKNTAIGPKL